MERFKYVKGKELITFEDFKDFLLNQKNDVVIVEQENEPYCVMSFTVHNTSNLDNYINNLLNQIKEQHRRFYVRKNIRILPTFTYEVDDILETFADEFSSSESEEDKRKVLEHLKCKLNITRR